MERIAREEKDLVFVASMHGQPGRRDPAGSRSFADAGIGARPPHDCPSSPPPTSVLVVDHEASIVDMLATLLIEEGNEVVRAYDGQQAWSIVRQSPPDLVISDVSMPCMGGLELARRMRQDLPCRRTPVILMSAAYRRSALDGTILVPKPFDLDRMLALVERETARA